MLPCTLEIVKILIYNIDILKKTRVYDMKIKNLINKVKLELRANKVYKHEFLNFEIRLTKDNTLAYNNEEYINNLTNLKLIIETALDKKFSEDI